ncbi:MAG: hypothetical protein ABL999_19645 [Pyrinomonadaceae bacterium]
MAGSIDHGSARGLAEDGNDFGLGNADNDPALVRLSGSLRLCRSICGKALLFRKQLRRSCVYAAAFPNNKNGGIAAMSFIDLPEKQSFSANRWAKPKI